VFEGKLSNVTIKLDGIAFDFNLPYNGEAILDAALKLGADLPFACKGGVCATCRAKLVTGEVIMDNNYALEPEEVKNGYILTCQSHPRSEKIIIDFDQR
jgi:ring-1,2-phenylacetyl-CoA epoxidase subunit PaaE